MDLFTYFWLFLKASLFSTSGTGNLPSLHHDLILRGWAAEHDFAESLAVGQITPGPSGLWVISLGYLTAGLPGALLALVAICIPPLLILLIERLHRRIGTYPAVQGFIRHLGLAVIGIFAVVMGRLLVTTGLDIGSLLIVVGTLAGALSKRVPVLLLLTLAACVGIAIY
jgi:chromate transporter